MQRAAMLYHSVAVMFVILPAMLYKSDNTGRLFMQWCVDLIMFHINVHVYVHALQTRILYMSSAYQISQTS